MAKLLRIEAVNLGNVIDDTEDLSTRRGGGYMLLQAVRDIEMEYREELSPVSTGASIGLFEIKNPALTEENVRNFIRKKNSAYRHATFMVDVVEANNFRAAAELAISKNRWRQMQALSFATEWGNSGEVCETDEIRPAAGGKYKNRPTSLSVAKRSRFGRELRQDFYMNELRDLFESLNLTESSFTDDTEQLSKFDRSSVYADIPSNLDGKMAVFYADGNSFGTIQRDCQDAATLKKWDDELKAKRRHLLRDLLAWLQSTELAKTRDGKLRFETLLWGGDEMLFLLPAWIGLEFAQKFFELTQDWSYAGKKLTHAAGLVFAKHSAPISQLQALAKKLSDNGKEFDRTLSTMSWIVLESFDHAGDNMVNFWKRSGIAENGWQKLLLTEEKIRDLRGLIAEIKDDLPRSAMVRALRILANEAAAELSLLQRSYESTDDVLGEARERFATLWQVLCRSPWQRKPESLPREDAVAWTVLVELWDYLLPNAGADNRGAAQ